MSLLKDVLNDFTKTMFSLRDMLKNVLDQSTVVPPRSSAAESKLSKRVLHP